MRNVTMVSLGGGQEIGASSHLYRYPISNSPRGSHNILFDAGARLIPYIAENYKRLGPDFSEVSHVDDLFLTHSHYDHCGLVPWVQKMYPEARVWMTKPNMDLSRIQWEETARAMERMEKREGVPALFSLSDIEQLLKKIIIIRNWERIALRDDLIITPLNAGHMLGATSFVADYKKGKTTVCHMGDFSFENRFLGPGAEILKFKLRYPIQTIVPDSTYLGIKSTEKERDEKSLLLKKLRAILAKKGVALFALFRFDRLQEMWEMLLRAGIPREQIVFDGNAERIFDIYRRYTNITPPAANQFIRQNWDRGRFRDGGPLVILAHGGMLQERSPAWRCLKTVMDEPRNGLFITGYMDPCSPGGELMKHIHAKEKTLTLGEEEFDLNCKVYKFSLSAHASGRDIEMLASRAEHQTIFVHGEKKRVERYLAKGNVPRGIFPENGKEVVL